MGQAAEVGAAREGVRERILVVEDSPLVRIGLKYDLEELGYDVLTADAPERALALAGHAGPRIDLLITDVLMPQMTGSELARELERRQPGLKTLYISGMRFEQLVEQGRIGPGDPALEKPFSPEVLASKIREVLRNGA